MASYNASVENPTATETRRPESRTQPGQQGMTTRTRQAAGRADAAPSANRAVTSPFGLEIPVYGYGSPFTVMRRMMEDMDRLIENAGLAGTSGRLADVAEPAGMTRAVGRDLGRGWTPAVELFEKEGNLVVRAELPGLRREDVEVDVNDGVLTIQGERKNEHEEKREGFFRSERRYGRFLRQIALPEGVTGESANAAFADGVLEVSLPLPKREETRRRIEIR